MTGLVVTALYVPADRPDRVVRALESGADAVIVDLEDAVAATRKADARAELSRLADAFAEAQPVVQVRVNARGTPWRDADLEAVAALGVAVRVPKVESRAEVDAVAQATPGCAVHVLLESALGVERAFEIAASGAASVGLGEADLRSQLGLPASSDDGLVWARSRVVVAAAAAGLPAPLMSVYADVRDEAGLAASCAAGRALGFLGRAAIHPRQLPVIASAFAPTPAEVARAREILARVGEAAAEGVGVAVLDDGGFVDAAMVAGARRTIALAERR